MPNLILTAADHATRVRLDSLDGEDIKVEVGDPSQTWVIGAVIEICRLVTCDAQVFVNPFDGITLNFLSSVNTLERGQYARVSQVEPGIWDMHIYGPGPSTPPFVKQWGGAVTWTQPPLDTTLPVFQLVIAPAEMGVHDVDPMPDVTLQYIQGDFSCSPNPGQTRIAINQSGNYLLAIRTTVAFQYANAQQPAAAGFFRIAAIQTGYDEAENITGDRMLGYVDVTDPLTRAQRAKGYGHPLNDDRNSHVEVNAVWQTGTNMTDIDFKVYNMVRPVAVLGSTFGGGNVGNGTISNVSLGPDAFAGETWSVYFDTSTEFTVTSDVSGQTANGTVGVPYDNGFIRFTINAGSTAFIPSSDAFTANVTGLPIRVDSINPTIRVTLLSEATWNTLS